MNGIGRYTLNLIRQIASMDRRNEYVILRHVSCPHPIVVQENFTEVSVPFGMSSARNLFTGAAVVNPIQADIYHALTPFLPIGIRAKHIVVTLHDLIKMNHFDIFYENRWRGWLKSRAIGSLVRRAVATADAVIAVSESTRQAALTHFALPDSKLTVIHHGVDPTFSSGFLSASHPAIREGRRLIFSLGNTRPYKNARRLIHAFGIIAPRHPDVFLIIGGRGDDYPFLIQRSHELGISGRVFFIDQLNDTEVRACFSKALFFAFPSLVEGFGLPLIEAMASGCPVLTSNTSSLPEIAGDAAFLVDPLDIDSIASGMTRLIEDESLRQRLIRKGRQRVARFTWQACAEKTLGVYHSLMNLAPGDRTHDLSSAGDVSLLLPDKKAKVQNLLGML